MAYKQLTPVFHIPKLSEISTNPEYVKFRKFPIPFCDEYVCRSRIDKIHSHLEFRNELGIRKLYQFVADFHPNWDVAPLPIIVSTGKKVGRRKTNDSNNYTIDKVLVKSFEFDGIDYRLIRWKPNCVMELEEIWLHCANDPVLKEYLADNNGLQLATLDDMKWWSEQEKIRKQIAVAMEKNSAREARRLKLELSRQFLASDANDTGESSLEPKKICAKPVNRVQNQESTSDPTSSTVSNSTQINTESNKSLFSDIANTINQIDRPLSSNNEIREQMNNYKLEPSSRLKNSSFELSPPPKAKHTSPTIPDITQEGASQPDFFNITQLSSESTKSVQEINDSKENSTINDPQTSAQSDTEEAPDTLNSDSSESLEFILNQIYQNSDSPLEQTQSSSGIEPVEKVTKHKAANKTKRKKSLDKHSKRKHKSKNRRKDFITDRKVETAYQFCNGQHSKIYSPAESNPVKKQNDQIETRESKQLSPSVSMPKLSELLQSSIILNPPKDDQPKTQTVVVKKISSNVTIVRLSNKSTTSTNSMIKSSSNYSTTSVTVHKSTTITSNNLTSNPAKKRSFEDALTAYDAILEQQAKLKKRKKIKLLKQ